MVELVTGRAWTSAQAVIRVEGELLHPPFSTSCPSRKSPAVSVWLGFPVFSNSAHFLLALELAPSSSQCCSF